jgi:CBS domain-containing protein
MQAHDIMITKVVTVQPGTTVREIANLMVDHRISGLPVVDESGRLVGIVTDGDLYRRAELGTDKRRRSWLEMFSSSTEAQDYVEAHGRTARDVMTADVVAVAPGTSLRQIADLFETRRIRRVPVVVDGRVVGIVSRANLVQALVSMQSDNAEGGLSDRRIRDLVLAEFKQLPWGLQSEGNVIVKDGVLHLWGFVSSDAELAALRVAAEAIPGVTGFEDHTIRLFGDVGGRLRTGSKVTVVEPDGTGR